MRLEIRLRKFWLSSVVALAFDVLGLRVSGFAIPYRPGRLYCYLAVAI
ncbi:MAG: hypothetical protein V3W44_02205 [Dehalococcoidales bacterium]